jgi:hypothetical protein
MYLIHGLIMLAIMFFIVLPITDARTVRMKLSVAVAWASCWRCQWLCRI